MGDYPDQIAKIVGPAPRASTLNFDARTWFVLGACLEIQAFGALFKARPSPLEIFFLNSNPCGRLRECISKADVTSLAMPPSPVCLTDVSDLMTEADIHLELAM